jgi:hypothetical protein
VLPAIPPKGVFFFAYVVLAFVILPANTPEERAAAYGEAFSAQEPIDRAKRTYAGFTVGGGRFGDLGQDWGRPWRRQEPQWRHQFRSDHAWSPGSWCRRSRLSAPCSSGSAHTPSLSLAAEREAFGVPLPEDVPLWAGISVSRVPLSVGGAAARGRRASYRELGGPHYAAVAALDGLLSVGVGISIVWLASQSMPEVRELLGPLLDV